MHGAVVEFIIDIAGSLIELLIDVAAWSFDRSYRKQVVKSIDSESAKELIRWSDDIIHGRINLDMARQMRPAVLLTRRTRSRIEKILLQQNTLANGIYLEVVLDNFTGASYSLLVGEDEQLAAVCRQRVMLWREKNGKGKKYCRRLAEGVWGLSLRGEHPEDYIRQLEK